MISRRHRKNTGSVERLKQGSFTAAKGVDVTASVLSTDTVINAKNLDIQPDGSLSLRKPIASLNMTPEVSKDDYVHYTILSDVLKIQYLYDTAYRLIVRKGNDGTVYFGIFNSEDKLASIRLHWTSWIDYSDCYKILSKPTSPVPIYNYYIFPDIHLNNLHCVNTPTSTIITNITVNIASGEFKDGEKEYPTETSTDIYYSELYDIPEGSSTLLKPRTLLIRKSTAPDIDFDLSIVTPDVNTISTSDALALNINLDLDNPYAIRDSYNTSAPSIKNILGYVPTITVGDRIEVRNEDATGISNTVATSRRFSNSLYTGYTFNPSNYETKSFFSAQIDTSEYVSYNNSDGHPVLPIRYSTNSSQFLKNCDSICTTNMGYSVHLALLMWLCITRVHTSTQNLTKSYMAFLIGSPNADPDYYAEVSKYIGRKNSKDEAIYTPSYYDEPTKSYIGNVYTRVPVQAYTNTSITAPPSNILVHMKELTIDKVVPILSAYSKALKEGKSSATIPYDVHGIADTDRFETIVEAITRPEGLPTSIGSSRFSADMTVSYPTKSVVNTKPVYSSNSARYSHDLFQNMF